ncbi:hypothetical protein PF001_g24589 [Phytophthora fragariae]|uniref:Uncharacterized protein n=1 Tax=Phytophthora fragariae TaxID=53985 RepID=A0A6A3RRY9_9STRA|nr:hypothetical protein PF003_g12474 [Phytophthora fragariae]KAE9101984.1 hypothetical protein PF006_g22546 [Phytophthora fragariae]KAE9279707.1 hypothetical protein PF001_g24589 [Phytophthora fragariae]
MYRDWQVLAYASAIDRDLLKKEQRLYAEWLSHQPQLSIDPTMRRRRASDTDRR